MRAVLHTNSASVVTGPFRPYSFFFQPQCTSNRRQEEATPLQNIPKQERESKKALQKKKKKRKIVPLYIIKSTESVYSGPPLPRMPSLGAHGAGRQLLRLCNVKTTFILPFQNIPSIQSKSGKVQRCHMESSTPAKTMLWMTNVNRRHFSQLMRQMNTVFETSAFVSFVLSIH